MRPYKPIMMAKFNTLSATAHPLGVARRTLKQKFRNNLDSLYFRVLLLGKGNQFVNPKLNALAIFRPDHKWRKEYRLFKNIFHKRDQTSTL